MRLTGIFTVRAHTLRLFVTANARYWCTVIDDSRLPGTFKKEAEAWEAGVREAERLDRASGESSRT
jgi:hypothetical protein